MVECAERLGLWDTTPTMVYVVADTPEPCTLESVVDFSPQAPYFLRKLTAQSVRLRSPKVFLSARTRSALSDAHVSTPCFFNLKK